jgi:hypothetical protein
MSTKHSVGRSTATQERVRSTATQEEGRSAVKQKKDRSPNLCAFTFADGRQCRTPRCSGHLHLCYFHAQKEAQSLAAQQVGEDISRFLPTKLLTACDLGAAMSRLFCAVAQGQVKPKVASTLAYLAQTMLQSIPIAQHEYIESFSTNTWRSAVRCSFRYDDPAGTPAPQSEIPTLSGPAPQPPASASAPTSVPASPPAPQSPVNCHSACPDPVGERSDERPTSGASPESYREEPAAAASSSNSSLATHHSPLPQPAPSPHTPLPPTSTEFAQQLLAGLNSSRSEIPTPSGSEIPTLSKSEIPTLSGPGPEPVSSATSSSTAPTTPQPPVNCHPEPAARREEPASSSSSNSPLTTRHFPQPQCRSLHRLCHPALVPPPTGKSSSPIAQLQSGADSLACGSRANNRPMPVAFPCLPFQLFFNSL